MRAILIVSILLVGLIGIISVPPAFASIILDTSTSNNAYGTNATLTLIPTIGIHSNKALFVVVQYRDNTALSPIEINSVKLGSLSFTKILNKTAVNPGDCSAGQKCDETSIWELTEPIPTGTQHITITPSQTSSSYYIAAGVYSLYNVNQVTPFGATNSSLFTSSPTNMVLTPTHSGAWLIDSVLGDVNAAPTSPTPGTQLYAFGGGGINAEGSQYVSSPSIGSKNTLSWSISGLSSSATALDGIVEILPSVSFSTPTLSNVNTINNTAINGSWTKPPGTSWFWFNATLSGGATTHINTTKTTVTLNNYTAGSEYIFSVVAANSTAKSFGSVTKFNYTTQTAPISPIVSSITSSGATLSVTPPSGNVTGGYKVYTATPNTGPYTLAGTTLTSSINLSGLTGNTQYIAKFSTRYAVGTNYSGLSANSTTVSFYTLPSSPSGLSISQSVVNVLHLVWAPPTDNGTVLGYKIERSINYGFSWLTIVSNTGSSSTTYDDSGLTTGDTYTYRVSTIQLGGTSLPTSPVSATVLSSIQLNPTNNGITSYNTTASTIPWTTTSRTSYWDIFTSASDNGTITSWYRLAYGSNVVNKILGSGVSSVTLSCTPNNVNSAMGYATNYDALQANGSTIYFACNNSLNHFDINTGTITHDFNTVTDYNYFIFINRKQVMMFSSDVSGGSCAKNAYMTTASGNTTLSNAYYIDLFNSQNIHTYGSCTPTYYTYAMNGTSTLSTNIPQNCGIVQNTTSITGISIDAVGCDFAMPMKYPKYWNGFLLQNGIITRSLSALPLLDNIETNTYKKELTMPPEILGIPSANPAVSFVLHSTTDYMVLLNTNNIYDTLMSNVVPYTLAGGTNNRAIQSYYVGPYTIDSNYLIPASPLQSMKIYGPSLNVTTTKFGLMTLFSGYTAKGTSIESAIRTVDPRWTNDNTDIPLLTTTSSLFQIILTVADAPTNAALMVTLPSATINSISGVWTVVNLDATHTAEFDIPANQCGLVYVSDISILPTIWNYEGQICATGVNQKSIAYTNTLPTSFYTLKYGVTSSFTPQTNGLSTSFHTTVPGTTYTVTINNATGATAQTYTFTVPANVTTDTHSYNVSGVSKPASLSVTVGGNQIYTAYLGSPLSLASVSTFFHQYLNYQGFDFLSFIPIIFAAMFTRNTVGVGMAMVVVCIATLSWLSVVVVPEPVVYISIFIAVIGMIGYRAFGY